MIAFAVTYMASITGVEAVDLPVRKSGRWQLTTVSESTGLHKIETCITANDSIIAGNETECTTPDVNRKADETFVNIVCQSGADKRKVSMLLTGDFSTWYRAVTKITFDPPQNGVSHLGAIVDGKYLGSACTGDAATEGTQK